MTGAHPTKHTSRASRRAWTTAGAVLGVACVAAISLRGGFFARGARADFGRGVAADAMVDGVIEVPGEAPNLQAAIEAAADGMTIRLGEGDFVGPATVEGKSLRIEGQGMARTTLHALGRGPVLTLRAGTAEQRTELAGLSIMGGSGDDGCGLLIEGVDADIHAVRLARNAGSGAVVRSAAPSFSGCRFEDNASAESGGGIRNIGGGPVLVDCVFERNVAATFGGAIYSRGGSVNLLDCTLESNSTRSGAWGGAIFGEEASVDLFGTSFSHNRSLEAGGALYLLGGRAEVERCSFTGDYAEEARAIFSRGAGLYISQSTLCGEMHAVVGGDFVAGAGNSFDTGCFPDCNGDGISDSEEILQGWAEDIDGNGIPDECDADCNSNGFPDAYEIRMGWAQDLNGNGLIDSCEPNYGAYAPQRAARTPAAAPETEHASAPAPAAAHEPAGDPEEEERRAMQYLRGR
ncbi:MAG: hypothetical protein U0625_04340 [Phycisphaerales bacterium]